MVFVTPFIGAVTLLAGFAVGLPRPDSAVGGEVAVSAPNGIPLSDTAELSSQLASETALAQTAATSTYVAATTTAPAYDTSYASPTAAPAYSSPTYGSGSSDWGSGSGSSGYDSCVQQCVASFGTPPPTATAPPSDNSGSGSGSSGTGATHTVIVAPTQGVLRYVPFAVNASIGDTVRFMWNANNHTVTKSSELELCNKTSDHLFASGTHDKGFIFDQVVNDTTPTFFYCGTPGHCQKGMFGIINPPSAAVAPTSVGMMMQSLVANSSDLSAKYAATNAKTQGVDGAYTWGGNIDLASMPDWSHDFVAENVMYARQFMASNPDVINPDGSINMNTNAPLSFPTDLTAPANAAASPSGSPAASSAAPAATSAGSGASSMNTSTNGAGSTAVSSGLFAVAVVAASFLVL